MTSLLKTILQTYTGQSKARDAWNQRLPTVYEQFNTVSEDDLEKRKVHPAEGAMFHIVISVAVCLQSLMLGIEVDSWRGGSNQGVTIFYVLDILFFIIFAGEVLLRNHNLGWDYYTDSWNCFDYILVVFNGTDLVHELLAEDGANQLKIAACCRIIRLLRIARGVKGLKVFKGLWLVTQGMLDSLSTIAWVATLLLIIVYCLAIILTTIVAQHPDTREHWVNADQYVGTVIKTMWTLFQIITFDAWASDVVRPMLQASPIGVAIVLVAIIVCSFGVLNVIVAVMVERTMTISKESREQVETLLEKSEQELLKAMAEDFLEQDLDENGEISYDDFCHLLKIPKMLQKLRYLGIQQDEAESLFDLMDTDNSGKVSPDEFITGLQKLRGPAKGQDLVTLICFAQQQTSRASRLQNRARKVRSQAEVIFERLQAIGHGITQERRAGRQRTESTVKVRGEAVQRSEIIDRMDTVRQFHYPGLKAQRPAVLT
eukprot:TRINITY_DN9135_c0_g1_i1.p1 TRINITY_DN9135_c0_g1~~TRINITY_DN9135_c0_g1_i1.p1  ORF type:complete len:520 (-),score=126.26 TRINITY_DN9135_c0_g1_i1:135-1592(-)